MVYGPPPPHANGVSDRNPSGGNGLGESLNSRGLLGSSTAANDAQPFPLSGTSGFLMGTPVSTPLSPTRRHIPALSNPVSTPIAVPTYNSMNDDKSVCGSPILKSYRQHSFSMSKANLPRDFVSSPTSPKATTDAHAGIFSAGVTPGSLSNRIGSPTRPASVGSQGPSGGGEHRGVEDRSGGGGGGAPIYQQFLEITGYPLGLENYGNTCYCNSVIQLLYHCPPLRLRLLELHEIYQNKKGGAGFQENTLLFHLSSLVAVMHKSNNRRKDLKKRELISPSTLLKAVKERNPAFNNSMQQDAHEFAMYILNDIMETESIMMTDPKNRALFSEVSQKKRTSSGLAFWRGKKGGDSGGGGKHHHHLSSLDSKDSLTLPSPTEPERGSNSSKKTSKKDTGKDIQVSELSPLQSILQGQFGSMTACLECGNISARDEVFIDLSLDTAQGSSLLTCLRHFGDPEYFYGDNRLRCDYCKDKARAAKTIHVQRLPEYALLVHLKRFRYDVSKQTFTKKADHVALPMTMDVEEYSTDPDELGSDTATNLSTCQRDGGAASTDGGGGGGGFYDTHKEAFKPADEAIKRKLRGVAKHKARFTLSGFVAHIGEGPSLGHYFTCVRYGSQLWRRFDDDVVSVMTEREVQQYFGVPMDLSGMVTTTAYILLYERVA